MAHYLRREFEALLLGEVEDVRYPAGDLLRFVRIYVALAGHVDLRVADAASLDEPLSE